MKEMRHLIGMTSSCMLVLTASSFTLAGDGSSIHGSVCTAQFDNTALKYRAAFVESAANDTDIVCPLSSELPGTAQTTEVEITLKNDVSGAITCAVRSIELGTTLAPASDTVEDSTSSSSGFKVLTIDTDPDLSEYASTSLSVECELDLGDSLYGISWNEGT